MNLSLKNILSFKARHVTSVGIFVLPDRKVQYSFLTVSDKKNKLQCVKKERLIAESSELLKLIPRDTLVCLNIDGKGIIHKKVKAEEGKSNIELLQMIFPKASPVDFYLQYSSFEDLESFISVIRTEYLQELLALFINAGIPVARITLGPFVIKNIVEYIVTTQPVVNVNGFSFTIENGIIRKIIKTDENSNQEEVTIKSDTGYDLFWPDVLINYSCSVDFFLYGSESNNRIMELQSLIKEFKYGQVFKNVVMLSLLLFLIILTINFFLFDSYNKKNSLLMNEVMLKQDLIAQLDSLQLKIKEQEAFIIQSGFVSTAQISFYADQLASSLPPGITLSDLSVNELKKKIKNGLEPEFDRGVVYITGETSNSNILNNWIEKLSKESWIGKIAILSFVKQQQSGENIFKISININDN